MVYYSKKVVVKDRYMNTFHNYIKDKLLNYVSKSVEKMGILDVGSGSGGELLKILKLQNLLYYLGLDLYIDEALKRLKDFREGKKKIKYQVFDFNKSFHTNKKFNLISFFFSFHYFFGEKKNLAENINRVLVDDGYVIMTLFDGELLKREMPIKIKVNGDVFFSVRYVDKKLNKIAVLNKLISDEEYEEYLVQPEELNNFFIKKCSIYPVKKVSFLEEFKNIDLVEVKGKYKRGVLQYQQLVNEGNETARSLLRFTRLFNYYIFRKFDEIEMKKYINYNWVDNMLWNYEFYSSYVTYTEWKKINSLECFKLNEYGIDFNLSKNKEISQDLSGILFFGYLYSLNNDKEYSLFFKNMERKNLTLQMVKEYYEKMYLINKTHTLFLCLTPELSHLANASYSYEEAINLLYKQGQKNLRQKIKLLK